MGNGYVQCRRGSQRSPSVSCSVLLVSCQISCRTTFSLQSRTFSWISSTGAPQEILVTAFWQCAAIESLLITSGSMQRKLAPPSSPRCYWSGGERETFCLTSTVGALCNGDVLGGCLKRADNTRVRLWHERMKRELKDYLDAPMQRKRVLIVCPSNKALSVVEEVIPDVFTLFSITYCSMMKLHPF